MPPNSPYVPPAKPGPAPEEFLRFGSNLKKGERKRFSSAEFDPYQTPTSALPAPKNRTTALDWVLCALVLLGFGFGGYMFYLNTQSTKEIARLKAQASANSAFSFDTDDDAVSVADAINVPLRSTAYSEQISTEWNVSSSGSDLRRFSLSLRDGLIDSCFVTNLTTSERVSCADNNLGISQEIIQLALGDFGADASKLIVLFLLADGSVEYLPITRAYNSGDYLSYGQINLPKKVVRLFPDVASGSTGAASTTVIVQFEDGEYADLQTYLPSVFNN